MTAPTSPVMQRRNAEMTALASADLLSVDDKNAAIEVYDNAGMTFFTLSDRPVITLNTLRYPNHFPEVFSFSAATYILTILEYGLYTFYGKATAVHSGGSSSVGMVTWVEEDPGTGVWSVLTASETYFAMPEVSAAKATGAFTFTKKVEPNYRYRLHISEFFGTSIGFNTVAAMSHLGVIRLFKTG